MSKRWLYRFDQIDDVHDSLGNWDDVRSLLGGKGANLGDMTRLGIPVPPGFTITTEACNAFMANDGIMPAGFWDEVFAAVEWLEAATGKQFGGTDNALLLACRSGAKFSMPGMMDTILDIGLNDAVAQGLTAGTGDELFVLDSYRRLIQMFGGVVLGIDDGPFESALREQRQMSEATTDSDLSADDLRAVIAEFRAVIESEASEPFPDDPRDQLKFAVQAVFESWRGKRAHDYRSAAGIPHDLGTAVNVMAMVFGNLGDDGATGVAMSRDATTGENRLEGDYLLSAQGEDVVAGIRATKPIDDLADDMPTVALELAAVAEQLERHFGDMQDMEFTVEAGKLWLLQTRTGKRTAPAAVRIAVDLATEGAISREEAVLRVSPDQVDFFLHPQFDPAALAAATPLATGLNVSPGAAVGVIAFDPDIAEQWSREGRDVLLVRPDTKPDDVHGMLAATGLLTSSGGRTSHAALVARQFGKPAVVGAVDIDIDIDARVMVVGDHRIEEGEWASIDGSTGHVYEGRIATTEPDLDNDWLTTLLEWADELRTLGVRANADNAVEARRARRFGAAGVGLCRTEHMFLAHERLPLVQRMIIASTPEDRLAAIDDLYPLQRDDFVGLLEEMAGYPVIIRLLDPPLHEFLPSHEELASRAAELRSSRASGGEAGDESTHAELAEIEALDRRVNELREANPMLGLRGVRLGLQIPELMRMQTRAIVEAALFVRASGKAVDAKIMVPLVGHASEMAAAKSLIEDEMASVLEKRGASISIPIGTMIEVPRAALTAGEIALEADFFSFGTNDLTQMTLGMSRDDAEAEFLLDYLRHGVIADNPFRTIDEAGVGRLIETAVTEGRAARPDLEVGICGEHGGDPASIMLCHRYGLDYVSCSAYRVPVARLAAAHAALLASPDGTGPS
jgi:pyruvate, orthophosphate dikinase